MTINILIADDNQDVCNTLEEALLIEAMKFGLSKHDDVTICKAFTDHAYEHGCHFIQQGFKPDICVFDLIFNGSTGIDLYKFIQSFTGKYANLCIYTGIEQKLDKYKEAEMMASMTGVIKIVEKPNISEILEWFDELLINKLNLIKKVEEKDPFDLL